MSSEWQKIKTRGRGEYFQQELKTTKWLVSSEMLEVILHFGAGLLIDKEHSHVEHSEKEKKLLGKLRIYYKLLIL